MAPGGGGPGEAQDGERPPPRPIGDDIAISVPAGVRPGHTKLAVEVGDGHELLITVPLQAEAGDRLILRRGDKGAWACTLSRLLPCSSPPVGRPAAPPRPPSPSCGKRITFLVPPDVRPNGMRLSVDADGEKVVLKVPVGAAPGDKVVLTKEPQPAGAGDNGSPTQTAAAGAWRCTLVRERLAHNEVTSGRRDLHLVADLPPLRAPAPDPEAASRRLFDAMRAAGGTVSRKMVRGRAPPLNIPGVVAAEHIQAGEVICSIPARFHLSPEMVERIAPRLWRAAAEMQEVPAGRRAELAHAAFVACLLHDAEDRAAAGSPEPESGLAARAGVDPAVWAVWQCYADVLIGEDFAYHPYRRAAADPAGVCSEFDPSCEAHFFLDMAQDVCTIHSVVDDKAPLEECGFQGRRVNVGMFLRARLGILSRVFQTDSDSTLVPMGDSFNHAPDMRPGVSWCWDEEQQAMVVTAERDHQPGEELLCSYGPRSNLLLYRTYGFTIAPEFEPSWTYVVRPHMVRSIYEVFLPEGEREPTLVFDSAHVEDSLCTVLNAVGRGPGFDPAEFLRLVAARCLWPYDKHAAMQPALLALRRARQLDPTSHAWWAQLDDADKGLVQKDVLRIQMCEYLCLTAHLEAVDVFEGRLDEARCLKGTRAIRQLIAQALVMLREKRSFTIKQVPVTEDIEGAAEGGA